MQKKRRQAISPKKPLKLLTFCRQMPSQVGATEAWKFKTKPKVPSAAKPWERGFEAESWDKNYIKKNGCHCQPLSCLSPKCLFQVSLHVSLPCVSFPAIPGCKSESASVLQSFTWLISSTHLWARKHSYLPLLWSCLFDIISLYNHSTFLKDTAFVFL